MNLSRRQLLRSLVAAPIAAVMTPEAVKAGAEPRVIQSAWTLKEGMWLKLGPEPIFPSRDGMEFVGTRHITRKEASKFLDRVLTTIQDREYETLAIDSMMNEGGRDFEGAY
jgi:hypothetical protein